MFDFTLEGSLSCFDLSTNLFSMKYCIGEFQPAAITMVSPSSKQKNCNNCNIVGNNNMRFPVIMVIWHMILMSLSHLAGLGQRTLSNTNRLCPVAKCFQGKCLISMEALGDFLHFNTSYNFLRYLQPKLRAFEGAVVYT